MRHIVVGLVLAATLGAGCSSGPSTPDNKSCFAIVGNRGTISANISGLPAFSGIIPTGQANYLAASQVTPASFIIQATDTSSGTSVLVGGPAVVGTTIAGLATPSTSLVQLLLTTRSCTAGTGSWLANSVVGSASVTVTSASSTGVAGSFTGTVYVSPGTSSANSKTISGSFNATF
jgi:hypothetical protein